MIHGTVTRPSPPAPESGVRVAPSLPSLLHTLAHLGGHSVLTRLLVGADFSEDLSSPSPLTLFAPTDEAFAAIGETADAWLAEERGEALCDLLEHHLVRGAVDLGEALARGALGSVYGATIRVERDAGGVRVGGARVQGAPIPCANGLLVLIDRVLTVPLPVATPGAPVAAATAGRAMEPTTLAPRKESRSTGRYDEARAALLELAPAVPRRVEHVLRGAAALFGLRPS